MSKRDSLGDGLIHDDKGCCVADNCQFAINPIQADKDFDGLGIDVMKMTTAINAMTSRRGQNVWRVVAKTPQGSTGTGIADGRDS